jgi:hypothetical protein
VISDIFERIVNFFKGLLELMSSYYRKPTNISNTEGTEAQRNSVPDPLIYHEARLQEQRNKGKTSTSDNGGGGGEVPTPSHPSLTYEVWGTWWDLPSNVSPDLIYQHSGLVELLRFGPTKTIREPNSTAGLPENEYQIYKTMCTRVPVGRRVLYDYYWQNPSYYKTYDDYYKTTSDATTYTGGVSGFGDPSPVKFLSPWGTQSNTDTKTSFKLFLDRCKSDNVLFDHFWDDTEGYTAFGLGGNYNTYESTFDANGLPNNYPIWQSIPDPRRTVAIVNDARFTSVTNQNGRTFAQEVVQKFRDLIGNQSDTRTASQILSYYTTVTTRQDFNPPWGQSNDIRMAYYAFDAALYTYNFGTLRKDAIINALSEKSLSTVKVFQSDVAPLTVAEAKYATDYNTHYVPRDYISGYGSSLHFFGQNGVYGSYGYTKNPSTDDQRYALVAGGSPFISPAHMAFIIELRKMRGLMRSRTTAYEQFVPVVTTPSNTFNQTKFSYDPRYWYEMMYHLCLHGANYFNVFSEIHTQAEMSAVQTVLDNWKIISGNNKAIPVSNSAGSTTTLVDRVNLEEAAEIGVISGGYVPSLNKWIWRLTAPPGISNYTLNDPSQTDLPQSISIPSNSRGVWIERTVAGRPDYRIFEPSYEVPQQVNKRLFAQTYMSIDQDQTGNDRPWKGWTYSNISFFQGNPYPTGTRAYPFEFNPVNPETSSPWHNIFYNHIIDVYKWGSRSFAFYGPFGTELISWFLDPLTWKTTHTSTTNKEFCPARWKGFNYALRSVLEGNMIPVNGGEGITEPCNVELYLSPQRAVKQFKDRSNAYWLSLGSTNEERDVNYYKKLDEFIDEFLISAKGRYENSGKLYISLSSTIRTATPSTVHLFRSLSDYRTDALELSDWYIRTKLANNDIVMFFESRGEKTINRASSFNTATQTSELGTIGTTSNVDWAGNPMIIGEYWLWYSNPDNSDVGFDNFITNQQTPLILRTFDSAFPLIDYTRDPYQTPMTYTFGGFSKTITYDIPGNSPNPDDGFYSAIYTPSNYLWSLYALSDNLRYYSSFLTGEKINVSHLMTYAPERFMLGSATVSLLHPVFGIPAAAPEENYWRVSPEALSFRPLFNQSEFLSNPTMYGSQSGQGWWRQDGITFWDINIRKNTFTKFIQFLETYSSTTCPPNTLGCSGVVYGDVDDDITRGVMSDLLA